MKLIGGTTRPETIRHTANKENTNKMDKKKNYFSKHTFSKQMQNNQIYKRTASSRWQWQCFQGTLKKRRTWLCDDFISLCNDFASTRGGICVSF